MRPIDIRTERLRLRRGAPADAAPLFEGYTGSEERSRFLARGVHRCVADTARFVSTWCDARWDDGSGRFAWIVADGASNEAIGTFVLIRERHVAEVHFGLSKAHEGRGLATQALDAVVAWIETHDDVQRIGTACDMENVGARRVLAKAGFRCEGVLERWLVVPAMGPVARDCASYSRIPSGALSPVK